MIRLMKWFTLEEPETQARIVWFAESFEHLRFEGVDRMLLEYLSYCAKLGIVAKRKYFEAFLITEGKQVIKASDIRLDTMSPLNYDEPGSLEEAYQEISAAAMEYYDQCMEEDLADRDFKVDIKSFMSEQASTDLQTALSDSFANLSTGDATGDVVESLQQRLDEISSMYSEEKLEDLDFLVGRAYDKGDSNAGRKVSDWGIPALDTDAGGIFTKEVVTFTGPTGGGKTRFIMANAVYRALTIAKIDVLVDELELTKTQIENMLIAHHIIKMYGGKIKIPDSLMNHNNLDEQMKRFCEAARIDLFESGKYGKLFVRTKELIVETMKRERLQFFRLNRNVQMWVVDYLGLIESKPGKYGKSKIRYEIITDGIKITKSIAKIADVAVIDINQYNTDGDAASRAGKPITPGMVEGGHIIQRHSDYDLAMTRTDEQKLASECSFQSVKVRGAAGLPVTPIKTDLSVSVFVQKKQSM